MWFLAVISIVSVADAALTKDSVGVGGCVCTNANSVNARETAGLNGRVAQSLTSGSCGKFKGGVQTADGYTWYQMEYAGKIVWVAGNYLDVKDGSFCSSTGACSAAAKSLACSLLNNRNLTLAKLHSSGELDNAYAYNNLRDTCNGLEASRSSYACNECNNKKTPAPGGSVCLSPKVLNYLTTLANKGSVTVNELAGACHSCTSKHYAGVAVDLSIRQTTRSNEYMDTCRSMGGTAFDESKTYHIHCEFNS